MVYELPPTHLCQPDILDAQIGAFKRIGNNTPSSIRRNGTQVIFVDWMGPMPIMSAVSKLTSEYGAVVRTGVLHNQLWAQGAWCPGGHSPCPRSS